MSIESRLTSLEEIVSHKDCGGNDILKDILLKIVKVRDAAKIDDTKIKSLTEDKEKMSKEIEHLKNEIEKKG
eukprot:gnl/Chilomastix_caulleri/2090.p1 GENE.gnl/Chilomastix_caulleri/2090~~gnl/Chilomastix_caulleri/2090.p1  ORF type:complete len:72 (+),score=21.07 gnl/Chilomastix_caulleri/2090:50-265(+)